MIILLGGIVTMISKMAPIRNKINAIKRNFPLNLFTGSSRFNVLKANKKPVIINTTKLKTIWIIAIGPKSTSTGVIKTPTFELSVNK